MSDQIAESIYKGTRTAFIDRSFDSDSAYKPRFISNDYKAGRKVLSAIEEELLRCEEFCFSVAFITLGGIEPLLQTLKTLETRGIPGKILTTDYMNFSEPKALDKLAGLSNIEVRMYMSADEGFHTKGYIFKQRDLYRIIVGSSNMTMRALTVNKEWNTKVVSTDQGEYTDELLAEFQSLWNSENTQKYDDFIERYRTAFKISEEQRNLVRNALREGQPAPLDAYRLKPNSMQVAFTQNLSALYEAGQNRALLISATGTGKTYASAFGARDALQSDRVLFIVHREQIAKQAMESYKRVFGSSRTFGLLSGDRRDFGADIVFATIQTLSKDYVLESFKPDSFGTVIIDEAHHSAADSYQKVLNYFNPRFMLGMTASPDRMDGYDLYGLFDRNIAYEIRLQQALEENLLCPFHYFGISEIDIDGEPIADCTVNGAQDLQNFRRLTSDQRIDHVLAQAKYFGYSGERVKGLIFVSRKDEGREISRKMNERGYKTCFLSGEDSQEVRENTVALLEKNIRDLQDADYLDYIISVDIFSEGIDIQAVNQIIMLRPTQSPIVFIQQLGRGLRRFTGKEFVVVLDFIGNYANNFLIPIALSGDRTYNKDNMRKYVMEGDNIIPGSSTIHFDEIARERIFSSIDVSTTPLKFLKDKYFALKHKLGKVPTINEFYRLGDVDPMLFIEYKHTSYTQFVRAYDSDADLQAYSLQQDATLMFVSNYLANGKRPHELLLLRELLKANHVNEQRFEEMLAEYGVAYREEDYRSAIAILNGEFVNAPGDKDRYSSIRILTISANDPLSVSVAPSLIKSDTDTEQHFVADLADLIEYGLHKFLDYYKDADADNLVLYQKYSRRDICRLLNWERDDSSTVYGYRIKYGTCPIFVTYEKKDDIAESTKYEDQFVDSRIFSWMTRSQVSFDSPESQQIRNAETNGLKIYLFIKKSDGEGTDFYYMGRVHPVGWTETTIKNNSGKDLPIMNFKLRLDTEVRNDIYDYLTV